MRQYGGCRWQPDWYCHHYYTFGALCFVSDEVCHHHSVAYHRFVCRACEVLGLRYLYDTLGDSGVLSVGSLDVASRGILGEDARSRLCRRYSGACRQRYCCACRSALFGPATQRGRQGSQHTVCASRSSIAVVGLVWI